MSQGNRPTILCLASYYKGSRFMQATTAMGGRVILITKESLAEEPWPLESIDERFLMPDIAKQPDITNAVSYLARDHHIDRIVPLDDYDVLTAAELREHLRLPGIGTTIARRFRDKLAMRTEARAAGIAVPDFVAVLNYDDIRDFMARVPPPWVLKPRSEAGAMGIKKLHDSEQLWRWLDRLGDEQSHFLLEQYVAGEVYHVDAIVSDGEIVLAVPHKYGQPPLNVSHEGGVFITRTLPRDGDDAQTMLAIHQRLLSSLGLVRGATHTEFIKGTDGQFYFLETAARVGGANIDMAIEAATGVNLWEEWAKLELAQVKGEPYEPPQAKDGYAGLMVCLARQERPDLSGYNDPEVVWRLDDKKRHAGLIVRSERDERVQELLDEYARRFAQDFLAYAPPLEKPPDR